MQGSFQVCVYILLLATPALSCGGNRRSSHPTIIILNGPGSRPEVQPAPSNNGNGGNNNGGAQGNGVGESALIESDDDIKQMIRLRQKREDTEPESESKETEEFTPKNQTDQDEHTEDELPFKILEYLRIRCVGGGVLESKAEISEDKPVEETMDKIKSGAGELNATDNVTS